MARDCRSVNDGTVKRHVAEAGANLLCKME